MWIDYYHPEVRQRDRRYIDQQKRKAFENFGKCLHHRLLAKLALLMLKWFRRRQLWFAMHLRCPTCTHQHRAEHYSRPHQEVRWTIYFYFISCHMITASVSFMATHMHRRTLSNHRDSIEISICINHMCYSLVVAQQIRAALDWRGRLSQCLSIFAFACSRNEWICVWRKSVEYSIELENRKTEIQQKYEMLRYL